MFKSKKVLILAIVMVLTLSLVVTGCSNNESDKSALKENKEASDEKSGKEVEVDIFQFKVEIAKELEEAAKVYEEENPNVKINIQTVGGGDDYGAALKAAFQSGNEPDIFNVGGPQDIKDWMDKLEDLSNQPWVDKALDGVLSGATVDDKVYALPFNLEGYGFVYNTEIFKAAGIDAEKIVDFKSLEEAVKALDGKIKNGELKDDYPLLESVFEFPAKETWITGLHTSNVALGQEFDSSIEAFNSEEVEFKYGDSLKKIIDLQADYSSNRDAKQKLNAVDYTTQAEEGIAIERVAIIQQGNWVYGLVNDVDEDVAKKLDILPIPLEGGKEDSIPVGVPMHWVVNKDSDDGVKDVAKDFLDWLYTSEKGKEYIVNEFHFIPPLTGYEDLEVEDSLGRAVSRYAEAGKTTPWVFMGYPTAWGMEGLGNNIQKYLSGEYTWEEVISESQAQWKEMR
ncbi:ABC transporter substrate-binding protein [Anaerosalibacter massiliensis]|uniref:ABC transporter substrate-binding protein n=1 Tax=Anaerosalibacter massiliensis TaxID=1347392 RepID=A0A9X2S5D6_9FIRM|nr:ABC transporter substrate-binding protein [Anaerosalibacter massiliensis]MCR2044460.1 ABC transporter substrate-binding protein [Anaerosalibacter massiliensis]